MKNNDQKKFGLVLDNIELKSLSQNSNENVQKNKYSIFSKFDDYYLVFTDDKHNKLAILKNQSSIKEGEEIIFYTRKMPDHIELMKYFDCGINCSEEDQLNNIINNLDNYLWKVLPKLPKEKNPDENKDKYLHHLNVDDIIDFGNNKLILREINFCKKNSKTEEKNKLTKRKYSMLYESIYDKKCDVCNSNSGNEPIIKICKCEKYYHIECLKESLEKIIEKKKEIGFTIFEMKTICNECKNFIPFNFIIKNGIKYEYIELIDIPRNIDENYLIFETLEFETNKKQNAKYIYFIKLTKKDNNNDNNNDNKEILILKEPQKNDVITFYSKIEKEKKEKQEKINSDDSNILASIEYDIKKKSLVLKCKNDNQDIKVLENKYIIEKDDKLILDSKFMKMKSYIITEEKFEEKKQKMEKNPDKIEEREDN